MFAGIQKKPITFLFVDTQILFEKMLEDINNALNSGDVPKLYEDAHIGEIKEIGGKDCKKKGIEPTLSNMMTM